MFLKRKLVRNLKFSNIFNESILFILFKKYHMEKVEVSKEPKALTAKV